MALSNFGSFKILLLLVVCSLTVHQVVAEDEEVSPRYGSCRAIGNKPGACIELGRCLTFQKLLWFDPYLARKVIRRSICGWTFGGPLVCCPQMMDYSNGGDNNNNNNNNNNNSNNEENSPAKPKEVLPLRPPQCGYSNKPHNRVVGGSPAELGAWPWIANIGFLTDDPNTVVFECGGSLISSRHVLTAGHCVYVTHRFFVRLGEYDLNSDDDGANPVDILVEKVTIHPRYNHDILQNDIAILKLDREVKFTDAIHPICLPVDDAIKKRNFVNNYPFVAGWGKTSNDGPTSNILREVQVPVVDEQTCQNNYRYIRNVVVNDEVICAGYAQGGKDACQGDSGGPLMFPQKQTWYLIGIVSGGYQCAEPDTPGLYTRVTSFLDFILSNLN